MTLTKCQTYLTFIGAALVVITSFGAGTVWALDTRYITIGTFEKALNKSELRNIKRDIRKLEYLKKHGQITPQQEWELEGLYQEMGELQQ